jgi:methylthioribose-1-phosphate isomerase
MTAVQSPLFEPVLWEGNGFRILDEISLPEQIQYVSVRDVSQAIAAVREMRTRAFGQVLTFFYSGALLAQNYRRNEIQPLRDSIDHLTQQFCRARPTFDFAAWVSISTSGLKSCRHTLVPVSGLASRLVTWPRRSSVLVT